VINDIYQIRADSLAFDERTHVLKYGETFAVLDYKGNIRTLGVENHGLFHEGTRFLSKKSFKLQGKNPLLLSSQVREDNDILAVDLTNPEMTCLCKHTIPQDTLHIQCVCFVWEGIFYEKIVFHSYLPRVVHLRADFRFAADFHDIFEVRGTERKRRGIYKGSSVRKDNLVFQYTGLDDFDRQTIITFDPKPEQVGQKTSFLLALEPRKASEIILTIQCISDGKDEEAAPMDTALKNLKKHFQNFKKEYQIFTSNEQFNDWWSTSYSDLLLLISETPHGLYPYAGVPWFSTPFGRDGIITALQTLWTYPDLARGVLEFLAAYQAKDLDRAADSEPGKILHEMRKGEMANTGEIPFMRYYGSIDSTPLFIILAGYYFQRTGDADFIHKLWPSVLAALEWIDAYGDLDGDGFIEYERKSHAGLNNQGWKDSDDAVFHADGTEAEPPIALCEVQGYVYEAKIQAARMAAFFAKDDFAADLRRQAESLRARFNELFWCEDIGMYALALDGQKKPCRIKSSNSGQCLFSGIARREHAEKIAEQLVSTHFFSGWGIRTIASTEVRYNPMSYHNGSVWPHDNAIIAAGLSRYGFKNAAVHILSGLLDTSLFMNLSRLPELFCGFERIPKKGPVRYPVACMPQAWACGSVFQVLKACLGLRVDGINKRIYFNRPALPSSLQEIELNNMNLPSGSASVILKRDKEDVVVNLIQKTGDIELIIRK